MSDAAEQLEVEIHNVIDRYTHESDLRIMDLIAVLEKIKLDAVHCYHKHHDQDQKNENTRQTQTECLDRLTGGKSAKSFGQHLQR
jgi:hypothetical protein